MKQVYLWLLTAAGFLASNAAQGQYLFTDSNLNPYRQNFNALSGTATMSGRQVTAIPEVYAEAEFGPGNAFNYTPGSFDANDGSNSNANYYHFGDASGANVTDRAFGGIGGFVTGTTTGIGYVGIRFKNNTTATVIKNLEVSYAMEQWFNSTFNTAAEVSVSYLMGPTVDRLAAATGTWTNVPALTVGAPSTATTIGARDGNAATNRRVVSTTIPVNLAAGQEIMIRWTYALNANTNGNGLSIDDVVVTPQTNVFYSKMTGNLDNVATWGINSDGTGATPSNFSIANQTFYVQSLDATNPVERINGTAWTVSGDNSKIVVGTVASAATLRIGNSKNIAGIIDVNAGSYFYNNHPTNPGFTLGKLATSSLVEYVSSNDPQSIQAVQYGNLKLTGGNVNSDRTVNKKELSGNVIVTGSLDINNGSNLVLSSYDLTVLGSFSTFSKTAYVLANGSGRLRMRVPRASSSTTPGAVMTFPVGASYTSYTPVTLQQTSTSSDDVFEVRMLEGVAKNYNATTYAAGPVAVGTEVVNKTWLISKEVIANPATISMALQWNAGEATANFVPAKAHINHYTGGTWDNHKTEMGATGSGPYVATRTGISSFSPFSVSSRVDGALPVELLSFDAQRTGTTVTTTWATASEKNNDHFTVERSATGADFSSLGTVWGAGNSTRQLSYTFADKAPLATAAYYRLRQTDIDGAVSFSPVVLVKAAGLTATIHAVAVPNPSTGRFEIVAPGTETRALDVTNAIGARIAAPVATATENRLVVDLSAQPAGVYLIRLQTSTGVQVVRVMKN